MSAHGQQPAGSLGRLDELSKLMAALRWRLRDRDAGHQAADQDHAYLDALTRDEWVILAARAARDFLGELDKHLAAGRLLDLGILEQRAG